MLTCKYYLISKHFCICRKDDTITHCTGNPDTCPRLEQLNTKQLIPVSQLSQHIWNTRLSYQHCPTAAINYLYPIVKEQELTAQEIKEELYEFNYHQ